MNNEQNSQPAAMTDEQILQIANCDAVVSDYIFERAELLEFARALLSQAQVAQPQEPEVRAELERLINGIANTGFACGAYDAMTNTPAYLAMVEKSKAARAALFDYALSLYAAPVAAQPTGCHRSHPHEDMNEECQRKTVEARKVAQAVAAQPQDDAKEQLLTHFPTAHAKDVSSNSMPWWVVYLDSSGDRLVGDGPTEGHAWRKALAFIGRNNERMTVAAQPTGQENMALIVTLTLVNEGTRWHAHSNKSNRIVVSQRTPDEALRLALADAGMGGQTAPAVPDGWKLVPKEPTPEMLDNIAAFVDTPSETASIIYRAMIAAAPSAPAEQGEQQ